MKKLLTLVTCYLLLVTVAVAQTKPATQSATATPSSETKEVELLKDKLANKVLEMQKKNKIAVSGNITEVSSKLIRIKSADDTEYSIKIDDVLSKVYIITGATKKESRVSDLKKGAYIIVSGPQDGKIITANSIYQDEQFIAGAGKITEVNKEDYFLRIMSTNKETVTLDIESGTKSQLLDIKTLGFEVIGFSKIKEGDTIHYVVKRTGDEREKNRYSAVRIFIIPQEYFIK